ncbi:MAG TPA: radical SAM protein [Thermoanaerobaculia bacterium]
MTSPMVFGARKRVIKTLLWMRIAWLALRAYRNPRRAMSVVQRMIAERAKSQRFITGKYAQSDGRYFWNFYSPGFPSRAFDRFVECELDRIEPFRGAPPALQSAIFAITKRCPLQCEHCCEWAVLNDLESLSDADLHAIVQRVRIRGVAQLFLSGGEPLRRFHDLLSVIELASSDADVWILTSGHGLSEDRARRLRSSGLTGVALSLDHWDAESHDRFRGLEGAYASVEHAANSARDAGLVVALSLCPTRAFVSSDNLERYAETARHLGASFIQILEPKAVGRYAGADVALTTPQQRMLEQFADRLNIDPAYRDFPAVAYADFTKRSIGCFGAGDRYIYIDTDGALHPCPFCRVPAGHALEGDFDDALARLQAAGCPARAEEVHAHG